jgi:hypothetical protein
MKFTCTTEQTEQLELRRCAVNFCVLRFLALYSRPAQKACFGTETITTVLRSRFAFGVHLLWCALGARMTSAADCHECGPFMAEFKLVQAHSEQLRLLVDRLDAALIAGCPSVSQARIAGGLAGCFTCPAAGPLRGWVEGRSPTRRRQSSRQGPRRGRFTAIGFRASSFLIPSELVRSRASSCHLGTPGVTPGLALCF